MELQKRLEVVFPNSEPDEKVILFIRKHWFLFFVIFLIIFGMLFLPSIFIAVSVRYHPSFFSGGVINLLVIFSSMYLLFIVAAFLLSFINLYFDIIILTNKRVIDISQIGLFNRKIDELDILHIEDVSAKVTGLFGTWLDYGEVEIQTAGTARNFLFTGIPHPRQVCRQILRQYKEALSSERIEEVKKIDGAEGLGIRLKPLSYKEIHGKIEPSKISQPPKTEGELSEGKIIDLRQKEDRILIKFNIEKARLNEILNILPALKSPTVNQLANPNFDAVETVVKKSELSELLPRLKERGAKDIIQSEIKVL